MARATSFLGKAALQLLQRSTPGLRELPAHGAPADGAQQTVSSQGKPQPRTGSSSSENALLKGGYQAQKTQTREEERVQASLDSVPWVTLGSSNLLSFGGLVMGPQIPVCYMVGLASFLPQRMEGILTNTPGASRNGTSALVPGVSQTGGEKQLDQRNRSC